MPPTPEEIREQKVHQAQALIKSTLEKVMDDVTEATDHDIAFEALRAVLIEADVIDEKPEYSTMIEPELESVTVRLAKGDFEFTTSERICYETFTSYLDAGFTNIQAMIRTIRTYPANAELSRPEFWDLIV